MSKERKSIVVSANSLNRYGFRVLSEGIDLKAFKSNPVMLWNHHRTWKGEESEVLPIGRWVNLRVEDGKLIADPEFDEDDPFAMRIKTKWEKGIINTASVWITPLKTSSDEKDLVKGQQRPTVTKSELKEISLVDIPGNKESITLVDRSGDDIRLNDDSKNSLLPKLNFTKQKENFMEDLKLVAKSLGNESLSATEIIEQIRSMEKRIEDFEKKEEQAVKEAQLNLVDSAIKAGKIKKTERETYLSLAHDSFEATKKLIEGLPVVDKKLSDGITRSKKDEESFDDLQKNNPDELLRIKREEPDRYRELLSERKKK